MACLVDLVRKEAEPLGGEEREVVPAACFKPARGVFGLCSVWSLLS